MSMYIVYCHTNRSNGKRYIGWATVKEGQTSYDAMMRRWREHCYDVRHGSKFIFHNAIRKHGVDNWDHEVLETHPSEDLVKATEIRLIVEYRTLFHDYPDLGYNMTPGGDGRAMLGELNSFFGHHHSAETRAIIKQKRALQTMTCSPEKAEKIRQTNLKTFAKLKLTGMTVQRSKKAAETRKLLYPKQDDTQPVLQYNGNSFVARHNCINDALIAIGKPKHLYNGSIRKCCNGVYKRAYGFEWRWADDINIVTQ